ncbi:MAG: hypothetical protein IKO00_12110 [Oscillospiraceae bacterium]|nr:hypothetical protein [Oscillospiraceae bacterium]
MSIPNDTLISSVPAAAELRRVAGFNPLRFLRQTVSVKTGKPVLKLDLPYKRLWFRLACPNGKMLLNPLRITEQAAIYEAAVYMDRADADPLARVTSTMTAQEAPNGKYIEAAQDAALNEALENAGFGIQLCDFVECDGRSSFGSEVTLDAVTGKPAAETQTAPKTTAPAVVQKKPEKAAPVKAETPVTVEPAQAKTPAQNDINETAVQPAAAPADAPTPPVAEETAPDTAEVQKIETTEKPSAAAAQEPVAASTVIQFPAAVSASAETAPAVPQTTAETTASYSPDMSVEDICARMTPEEAKNVVVTSGFCKGWTLEQVAEKRQASLRYYMCAPNVDNVLKAAAQIMLDEVAQRKAS